MPRIDVTVIRRLVLVFLLSVIALAGLSIPSETTANELPGPDPPQETLPPPGDTLSPDTTFNSGSPPGDRLDSDIISIIIEAIF